MPGKTKIKIAVHAKVLSEERYTGIGVYVYNILKAISKIDKNNEYFLYSNEKIIHHIDAPNFHEKILKFPKFWTYLRFPFEFIGGKYDILFMTKETLPPVIRPKTVLVCFDLMGSMFSKHIALNGKIHFWIAVNYALKRAGKIITISESTKKDIMEKCKIPSAKVIVTPLGYDKELFKVCKDPELIEFTKAKYGIVKKYYINTSSLLWYRKNLERIIEAFYLCKTKSNIDYQLVITGKKGESYEGIISKISALGLEKDVILTDYIPEEDMPVLLSGAEALVFPSLHEGFGLPIIEAMACACPVIASNVSASAEVAENAGLLVDPLSIDEIAGSMEKIVKNRELREVFINRGLKKAEEYSWENTAKLTLRVFEEFSGAK